jgi:hypothetical protein
MDALTGIVAGILLLLAVMAGKRVYQAVISKPG